MFDTSLVNELLQEKEFSVDLDDLDIPEPEYEIELFDNVEDSGCEGGACKI